MSTNVELEEKSNRLFDFFDERNCVVAFSGGVDSATLARALVEATRRNPTLKVADNNETKIRKIAPTGFFAESATATAEERRDARTLAKEIGIDLQVLESEELNDSRFVENSPLRCYYCKKIRFAAIRERARALFGDVVLLDGSNADDKGDFRPGTRAAREIGVRSPFAELGITKTEVRALAALWGLSVARKPSNPCLATRLAYGLRIEEPALRRIETIESMVKRCGATTCRARVDAPNAVRIEVPEEEIDRFAAPKIRRSLVAEARRIGFDFVSLDLEGFASGKGNRGVDVATFTDMDAPNAKSLESTI